MCMPSLMFTKQTCYLCGVIREYKRIHAHIRMYIYIHNHKYINEYIHTYICIYVHVQLRRYARLGHDRQMEID